MRVLLVSFFFPPYNAIGAVRMGKLARDLHAWGHDVRVITADAPNLSADLPVEIPRHKITATRWRNVNSLPARLFGGQERSHRTGESEPSALYLALRRMWWALTNLPDGQVGWFPYACQAGKTLTKEWHPDVIYASATPFTALLVGAQLSRQTGAPLIAEYRDLWVDNHYLRYPWFRRLTDGALERLVFRSARALVTVSEPLAETLREKSAKLVAVVPNGYDSAPCQYRVHPTQRSEVVIAYTGIVYPGSQDPAPLFEALTHIGPDRKRIRIRFCGRILSGINALARRYDVEENVETWTSVSYQESLEIQHNADVLLLLIANTPSWKGVYTAKIFEYLASRRPILLCGLQEGVAAELVRQRHAGVTSNDPVEIAQQLRRWLETKQTHGQIPALSPEVHAGLSRQERNRDLERLLKEVAAPVRDEAEQEPSQNEAQA